MTDNIFAGKPLPPLKEDFKYHDIVLKLGAGDGEGVSFEVKCRGKDADDCVCDTFCQVKDTLDMVGLWDVLRSENEVELCTIQARMDWTDPEEPWVEVNL